MKLILAFAALCIMSLANTFAQAVWTATAPLSSTFATTTCMAINPVNEQIFVGTMDGGILRSTNYGLSWEQIHPAAVYSILIKTDGTVVAGGKGIIYRSTDNSQNWTSHTIATSHPIRKLIADSGGRLYAGTGDLGDDGSETEYFVGDGVFTSSNNGQTWTADNQGFSGTMSVWTMAVGKNDQVYIGTHDGNGRSDTHTGLYTRTKEQMVWQPVHINFKEIENMNVAHLYSIAIDGDDSLYIGLQGSLPNTNSGMAINGTLKSPDGGRTWRPLHLTGNTNWNYWDQPVAHSLYAGKSGTLWASNWPSRGILVSKDKGQTWVQNNSNISLAPFSSSLQHFQFAESISSRVFTMQAFDNVVYTKIYLLGTDNPAAGLNSHIEVFPNPFQEQLNLRFPLPDAGEAVITIHDSKGTTVFSRRMKGVAGVNYLKWNATQVPAGIYSVSLKTETYHATKRVVLAQ